MISKIRMTILVVLISAISIQPVCAGGEGIAQQINSLIEGAKTIGMVAGGALVAGLIIASIRAGRITKLPKVKDAVLDWVKEGKLTRQDLIDRNIEPKIVAYAKQKNRWDGKDGLKNVLSAPEASNTTKQAKD